MKHLNTIIRNIIKGPVTSAVGIAIIIATSYQCIFKDMLWIWQGLAGCGVGAVFIFTPDSIKEIISAVIKKKTS